MRMAPTTQAAPLHASDRLRVKDSLVRSVHRDSPCDYWLLADVLPERLIEAMDRLPFPPPRTPLFDGYRDSNNATRVYFTAENQARYPVCREVVEIFSDPAVIAALGERSRTDLSAGRLRIEHCQDVDGFWLKPHIDIPVKLFTLLIYLSDDPRLADAGTDIYEAGPEHRRVATAPFAKNLGLMFVPGGGLWHGFTQRPIAGLRKSIIVNYVSSEWRSVDELAH